MDIQQYDGVSALNVREITPGTANEGINKHLAEELARKFNAMIIVYRAGKEPEKVFPPHVQHDAERAAQIVVKSWSDEAQVDDEHQRQGLPLE